MKGTTNAEKGGQGIIVKEYSFTLPYEYCTYSKGNYVRLYTFDDSDVPMLEEIAEWASNGQIMMAELMFSQMDSMRYGIDDLGYCSSVDSTLNGGTSHVTRFRGYRNSSAPDYSWRGDIFRKDTKQDSYDKVPVGKWHYYFYTTSSSTSGTGTGSFSIKLYVLTGGGELTESLISCAHEGVCA